MTAPDPPAGDAAISWQIDHRHSLIAFSARHMMLSNVRGRFDEFEGSVHFDEQHPALSSVEVRIHAGSINTRDAQRDAHLRSADFLEVEKYPDIIFKSKRIKVVDATHGRITGDLTIKDVTREVVLDAKYKGRSKSPRGAIGAGFSARAKISRKAWGLIWNIALETGGWLVSDEIKIEIEIEIREP